MKRTITKIIIGSVFAQSLVSVIIGTHSIQAYATEKSMQTSAVLAVTEKPVETEDLRVKALEQVFGKYNSPLKPYAKAYVTTADKYGVDWKLLPAISGLESSFGQAQMPGSYNSYGWGRGYIYFNSVESGIDTVLSGLKQNYINRGALTVEAIGPIYSESPTWAVRVKRFMNEIDIAYKKLESNVLTLTI